MFPPASPDIESKRETCSVRLALHYGDTACPFHTISSEATFSDSDIYIVIVLRNLPTASVLSTDRHTMQFGIAPRKVRDTLHNFLDLSISPIVSGRLTRSRVHSKSRSGEAYCIAGQ